MHYRRMSTVLTQSGEVVAAEGRSRACDCFCPRQASCNGQFIYLGGTSGGQHPSQAYCLASVSANGALNRPRIEGIRLLDDDDGEHQTSPVASGCRARLCVSGAILLIVLPHGGARRALGFAKYLDTSTSNPHHYYITKVQYLTTTTAASPMVRDYARLR